MEFHWTWILNVFGFLKNGWDLTVFCKLLFPPTHQYTTNIFMEPSCGFFFHVVFYITFNFTIKIFQTYNNLFKFLIIKICTWYPSINIQTLLTIFVYTSLYRSLIHFLKINPELLVPRSRTAGGKDPIAPFGCTSAGRQGKAVPILWPFSAAE